MGQKVNPNGIRLGINKTWSSRWFSKSNYSKLLHEDLEIKKYVQDKLKSASISKITIERAAKKLRLTIFSSKPGIIIGKKAKQINEEDAEEYIAGYCVVNDVSEREFQLKKEGQWTKGKSCDTFGPTGPYLVTKDEVSDVQNLKMYLDVNGKRMQDGSTKTMIFSAKYIVYYLSQFMSLNPGDIIATGTPPGVGGGMKPPVFLKAGDKMKLGIEGLGEQNQTCFQG